MAKPHPSHSRDQYKVRFPDGMRDQIAAAAKANGRSMNAEIIARLAGEHETLRDKFAAAALPQLIAITERVTTARNISFEQALHEQSRQAYAVADAMLAARKAGG